MAKPKRKSTDVESSPSKRRRTPTIEPEKSLTKAKAPSKAKLPAKSKRPTISRKPKAKPKAATAANIIPFLSKPTTSLDVFVCGEGESGELGLGAATRQGKLKPFGVKRPRLNDLLLPPPHDVIQLAAGGMHVVALTKDGKVVTWGVNDDGALGRDTGKPTSAPRQTYLPRDKSQDRSKSKSKSRERSIAADDDDIDLNPREATPKAIESSAFKDKISKVAATDSASFALTDGGRVYGWGTFKGDDGTLGFIAKDSANAMVLQKTPILIPELKEIVDLATGNNHVLALDATGVVWSWGNGTQAQLGTNQYFSRRIKATSKIDSLVPRQVFFWKGKRQLRIKSIACGHYCGFATDQHNQIWGWGLNNFAQVGLGRAGGPINLPIPLKLLNKQKIRMIKGGEHHTIACTDDEKVLSWGRCDDDQLGVSLDSLTKNIIQFNDRGKADYCKEPVVIPGISAIYVSAGIDHSIALSNRGEAYSWGFSSNYRTGLGTEEPVMKPTRIDNAAIKDRKITFADCGGQYLILAAPRTNIE